jgi:hypothetical protein
MAEREQTRSLLAAKLHIFPEIRRLAARNLSNPTDFIRLSQYVKDHSWVASLKIIRKSISKIIRTYFLAIF